MKPSATPIVHISDDRFTVTEWRFAPGAETGWHTHGHDYVIVPLTDGTLHLDMPGDQSAEARLTMGVPYSRREGVEHNVTNGSSTSPLAFLEIEATADHFAHRRRATMQALMAGFNARDLEALMACMSDDCAFHTAAGPQTEGAVHRGRDAVRAAYADVFATFPRAQWTEGQHSVAGDTGLSTWRFIGTSAAGAEVDVMGIDRFTFDGDLIALKDSYRKARN